MITILFFGATASITGQRRLHLDLDQGMQAREVYDKLLNRHPGLKDHRLHLSLNQEFATGDELLSDGDELAIFTAVSGG